VLLRCSAFFHQVGINVRRRRARRSIAGLELTEGNINTWYDLALNQPKHVQSMFQGNYRERCSATVRVPTLFRQDLIPIRSEANQDVFKWTIAAGAYVGAASEVPGDAIRIRNTAWGIIHMGEVKIQSRDDVRDAYRRAMGAPTFSLDDISERVIDAYLAEFPPQ